MKLSTYISIVILPNDFPTIAVAQFVGDTLASPNFFLFLFYLDFLFFIGCFMVIAWARLTVFEDL